jgi:hypothetical protein
VLQRFDTRRARGILIAQEGGICSAEAGPPIIAAVMVIASLNGTHAQGFIEVIERSDGSIERTGLLKLSAPSAIELRRLLDARAPLVYYGPVLANGRWRAETFSITATDVAIEPGCEDEDTLNITVRAKTTRGRG